MPKRRRGPKPKPLVISEHTYQEALKKATDVVFEYASDVQGWTLEQLAAKAKLHISTVYRLWKRETKFPRWQTFWKLASAVGLRMTFIDVSTGEVVKTPERYRTHPLRRLKKAA